jgi:hypothetical protein
MNRLYAIGSAFGLFLLAACPALAGDHGCGCSAPAPVCETPCCTPPASVCFRVDIQESKTVEMVEDKGAWKIVEKTTEKEVPVTKMVEVCVVDPCTGCKRTECHPETVMQKVKCTTIELCKEPSKLKPVEKITSCVNVYMTEVPGCSTWRRVGVGEMTGTQPPDRIRSVSQQPRTCSTVRRQ